MSRGAGLARLAGAVATCALVLIVGTLIIGGTSAAASCGGFESPCSQETEQQFGYGSVQRQDTPNDPDYDQAEPDTQQPPQQPLLELLRRALRPVRLPLAADAERALRRRARTRANRRSRASTRPARGRPSAAARTRSIAILDDGFVWGERGLRDQIHLNTGELPYPEHADGSSCGDVRLQRRRRRQRRGLRAGSAREPVLLRPRRARRADHRAGSAPRVRQLPDRRRART